MNTANTDTITCPSCEEEFEPKRTNQKYCSRQCQKNAARGSRKASDSGAERRRSEMRHGRLTGLTNALYETPPAYRAEFLERLIVQGRKNVELRSWLTLRELLKVWYLPSTGRIGIGHTSDHYCQEVYGMRSYVVLDPVTVLPSRGELAFPSEYFGPDRMPIYEDGRLRRRPCPWGACEKFEHALAA